MRYVELAYLLNSLSSVDRTVQSFRFVKIDVCVVVYTLLLGLSLPPRQPR